MTQYLRPDEPIRLSSIGNLPGIVTNIDVQGKYEIEKKKVEGRSGTDKIGHGYNDARVTVTLILLPPNLEAQVKKIEKAFKDAFRAGGQPKPIRIVNPLLDARDITHVLFEGFRTTQGNEDDSLECYLEYVEYEPRPASNDTAFNAGLPTVFGPQAIPVPATESGGQAASSTPGVLAQGVGAGAALATNLLGSPSAPSTPPFLSGIVNGGPAAESFIGGSSGGR